MSLHTNYPLFVPAKTRTTGLSVISLVMIIGGALTFVVALTGLLLGGWAAVQQLIQGVRGGLAVASLLILLVYAAGVVIVGIGLWQLKEWAWPATLIAEGLSITMLLILFLVGGLDRPSYLIGILVGIVVIWYMYRPDIKRLFDRP